MKIGAHLAGRAIVIVGQRLDDDGDAARPVALVADLVVVLRVAAGRLLDGALDIVLRHVLGAGGQDRGAQARIEGRIGHGPSLGRTVISRASLPNSLERDFVLAPLAVHDVFELGMTGHDRLALQ